jgi:hypothetical protein
MGHMHHHQPEKQPDEEAPATTATGMEHKDNEHKDHEHISHQNVEDLEANTNAEHEIHHDSSNGHKKHEMTMHDIHMHDMGGPPRPTWVTVAIGVSHCGAGCVLGM